MTDIGESKSRFKGGPTRPRSQRGKKRSRLNALKHGIFAKVVAEGGCLGEDQEDYLAFSAALRSSLNPSTSLEQIAVEAIAGDFFRLAKIHKADAKLAPLLWARVHDILTEEHDPVLNSPIDPGEFAALERWPTPDLLLRYETGLIRNLERKFALFERLRQLRFDQCVPPPVQR